jgi:hypothetical protein
MSHFLAGLIERGRGGGDAVRPVARSRFAPSVAPADVGGEVNTLPEEIEVERILPPRERPSNSPVAKRFALPPALAPIQPDNESSAGRAPVSDLPLVRPPIDRPSAVESRPIPQAVVIEEHVELEPAPPPDASAARVDPPGKRPPIQPSIGEAESPRRKPEEPPSGPVPIEPPTRTVHNEGSIARPREPRPLIVIRPIAAPAVAMATPIVDAPEFGAAPSPAIEAERIAAKSPEIGRGVVRPTVRALQAARPSVPAPPRIAETRPQREPAAAPPQETIVHVSIGRIEVRAAPPPAGAPREAHVGTAAMSLSDYLASQPVEGGRR